MSVVLNQYMITTDGKLFGKIGFTSPTAKTDKVTIRNLATIEAALDAGQLKDLAGNVVTDNAVIMCYALVTRVKDGSNIAEVPYFIDATGQQVALPSSSAAEDEPQI